MGGFAAVGDHHCLFFEGSGKLVRHRLRHHQLGFGGVNGLQGFQVQVVAVDVGDQNQVRGGYAREGLRSAVGVYVNGFVVPGQGHRAVQDGLDAERPFFSLDLVGGGPLGSGLQAEEAEEEGEGGFQVHGS